MGQTGQYRTLASIQLVDSSQVSASGLETNVSTFNRFQQLQLHRFRLPQWDYSCNSRLLLFGKFLQSSAVPLWFVWIVCSHVLFLLGILNVKNSGKPENMIAYVCLNNFLNISANGCPLLPGTVHGCHCGLSPPWRCSPPSPAPAVNRSQCRCSTFQTSDWLHWEICNADSAGLIGSWQMFQKISNQENRVDN